MAVQLDFLKNIAYFAGLSEAELEPVRKHAFEKSMEKGEIVVYEGEPAETLYLVASGVLKIFKTSAEGKEQILTLVRPGDSFNDVPVFGGGQNLASAEAMMPVTLYGIRKTSFYDILKGNSKVALNAIEVLCQRVTHLVSLVEDLSFRQVTGRVAKILFEHARSGGDGKPKLTQQEMAAMAGTAREMVGRSLRVLEEEGTIRLERHRIIIADEKALKEEAGIA